MSLFIKINILRFYILCSYYLLIDQWWIILLYILNNMVKSITKYFLPTLMESIVSDDEINLYLLTSLLLPIREGGFRISILEGYAQIHFELLKAITAPLVTTAINLGAKLL